MKVNGWSYVISWMVSNLCIKFAYSYYQVPLDILPILTVSGIFTLMIMVGRASSE